MTRLFKHIILLSLPLAALAGCSTGIDSTPRITATDVKREVGAMTPEQLFLLDVAPDSIDRWLPGKLLRVTDDRLKLLLGASAPEAPLAGSMLRFESMTPRVTPTGEQVTEFTFNGPSGERIVYTSPLSVEKLRDRGRVDIPFTIEKSLVDSVAAKLVGNSYFIITPDRFDADGNNLKSRKFVQVTIDSVDFGNSNYPLSVIFHETDRPATRGRVFMNVGESSPVNRSFSTLFSFSNPRRQYPSVTDRVWERVISNTIDYDMTRDECRLALGTPVNVERWSTGSILVEYWTYENGVYLRFEDGLLKNFRK